MQIDFVSFTTTLIGLALMLSVAYYSTKILTQMRKGILEKSWIHMSRGSLILACGVLATMIHTLYANFSLVFDVTSFLAPTLMIIGSVYIVAGFRAHYLVWNPSHPKTKMQELIEK